jgi:ribosomal-protein-alanine N-acetyltransferase
MDFPILETERLLLREWEASDAEALLTIYGDEDVVRYTPIKAYTQLEQAIEKAESFRAWYREKQMSIVWAIVLKETGKIVGEISLHSFNKDHNRSEIGYAYSRETWGKGIATETVRKVTDFGFTDFPLFEINRIEAHTDPRNTSSARVLEKAGYTKEGHLRESEKLKGEFVDNVIYGLLRSEYKK